MIRCPLSLFLMFGLAACAGSGKDGYPSSQPTESEHAWPTDTGPEDEGSGDTEPVDTGPVLLDTDGDGTPDAEDSDDDGDSLSDEDEAIYGTDPLDPDTDDDGFSDGAEVTAGTDPLDPTSVLDGLYVEVPERVTVEELFDFEIPSPSFDVAFLLDTSATMGSDAADMASEYSALMGSLALALPYTTAFGFATFADYPSGSFGSAADGDLPFVLRQPMTEETADVDSALGRVVLHGGGDAPQSALEALYQGLSGAGYDMGCDGGYDESLDVLPFLADPSDPFGGTGGEAYDPSADPDAERVLGGFGFADDALPILVVATRGPLRDPDSADPLVHGAPGGCPSDAGSTAVVAAADTRGARIIGISVGDDTALPQLQALAEATGSLGDTDGDGVADDDLVFSWTAPSATFRDALQSAIEGMSGTLPYHTVSLEVEGDEWGFVTDIDPESYAVGGVVGAELVDFTLTFRGVVAAAPEDQLFHLTLNLLGDGSAIIDRMDLIVVVPSNRG